ncbi:MAG: hypothetical protein ACLFOZ_16080 [Cyclobacteriaceae bacterium]
MDTSTKHKEDTAISQQFMLETVQTKAQKEEFRKLPFKIYEGDPNWIPHIRQEIEQVFDPNKNTYFGHGEAIRWILRDASGEVVGRVAAFVNWRRAKTYKQPTGGMGFFECIDNQEAANMLFNACKKWLQERDLEAMDGPINFGENNKYWGLIIDNFNKPPYYGQNYNPAYYVQLFENYGFKEYYQQYVFDKSFYNPLPELYQRRADRLNAEGKYKIVHFKKNEAALFARHFIEVYNDAWQTHDNFKQMTEQQAFAMLQQIKPVADEDLILFAYYEDEPIGFMVSLPNINEVYQKVGDNMNLIGKLKFLYYKSTMKFHSCYGVAFGVKQRFQARGVEALLFEDLQELALKEKNYKYDNYIVTWIGDFNPKMIRVMEALGAVKSRSMATYRKLFDENAVFERSPIIGVRKEKTSE